MKQFITFAFILIGCSMASAQVSGYMGKRALIRYDLYVIPAANPTQKYYEERLLEQEPERFAGMFYGINKVHQFSVEYVVGRAKSMGLNVFFNTTATEYLEEYFDPNVGWFTYRNIPLLIKNKGVGAFYRKYVQNKGGLAPVGNYHELGFSVISVSGAYRDTIKEQYLAPYLSYGHGNQRIIANRIPFEFGYKFGLILNPGVMSSDQKPSLQRTNWALMFNFKIGVGALLF